MIRKRLLIGLICLLGTTSGMYAQLKLQEDSLLLLIERQDNHEQKVTHFIELSKLYRNTDISKAMNYGQKAIELTAKGKADRNMAAAYANMGIVWHFCDDYVKSLDMFLKAKEIYMTEGSLADRIYISNCLGNVYSSINNPEFAINSYNDALQLVHEIRSKEDSTYRIMPGIYANIGMAYLNQKKYDTARDYTLKAISLSDKERAENIGIYYNNLSNIYQKLHDNANALKYIQLSLNWHRKHENKLGLARAELAAASHYLEGGKYDSVSYYIDGAITHGEELNSSFVLQDAYKVRADYERTKGNYRAALDDMERSYEHREKILNDKSLQSALKLKYTADFHVHEKQFQYDIALSKLKNNILYVVLGFILLSLLAVWYIYRLRVRRISVERENLKNQLELKSKELISRMMLLMEKNELINDTCNKLMELSKNVKNENKQPIRELIVNLRASSDNGLWQSFEFHFNQVYESFYENLKKDFPDLSPTELKLCAFLRLNLSTKEISSLLNLSSDSVDVMRSRIRKKVNLTNTGINLVSFLHKY